MKIAVIGTGMVGGTLSRRWAELGQSVCFGVRDMSDAGAKALVGQIKGDARLASVRDAAKDADAVVLATPYAANAAAIASAGDLSGKDSNGCYQPDRCQVLACRGTDQLRR
jgi:predicted dinucleotide-binding enzyme